MTSGTCFKFDATPRNAVMVLLVVARCQIVHPSCAQVSAATVFAEELQFWDHYQLPLCTMVLKRDCVVQQSETAKL